MKTKTPGRLLAKTVALLFAALLLQRSMAAAEAPDYVKRYLAKCEQANEAMLQMLEDYLKKLKSQASRTPAEEANVKELPGLIAEFRADAPSDLPLPLPAQKDDIGFLGGGKHLREPDILEIVDDRNLIVRVWYHPPAAQPAEQPDDPTFVDLWVENFDTHGLKPGEIVESKRTFLSTIFHVTGIKTFGTTCGSRAMPLLKPLDLTPYRRK